MKCLVLSRKLYFLVANASLNIVFLYYNDVLLKSDFLSVLQIYSECLVDICMDMLLVQEM